MKRGDMALWMLTKFAMLFFIFALAYIVFRLGAFHEKDVCQTQSRVISDGIASRISQVVFSPVEDERRVYSFESAIRLGQGVGRYSVEMTLYGRGEKQLLSIWTRATGTQGKCEAANSVTIGNPAIAYVKPIGEDRSQMEQWKNRETDASADPKRLLKPSETTTFYEKSRYLVIIKCSSKVLDANGQPRKYLFIENCAQQDPELCIKFLAIQGTDTISQCCGWPPRDFSGDWLRQCPYFNP